MELVQSNLVKDSEHNHNDMNIPEPAIKQSEVNALIHQSGAKTLQPDNPDKQYDFSTTMTKIADAEAKATEENKTVEEPESKDSDEAEISSEMTKNESQDGNIMTGENQKKLSRPKYDLRAKKAVNNNGKVNFPEHELLKNFPESNELEKLAVYEDIRLNGIRKPISIYNGQLIDGRLRLEIAKKLRLPFTIVEWEGLESSLHSLMDALHLLKKEYNASQRAIMAYENLDRFKAFKTLEEKKDETDGVKPKTKHDTNELAVLYYKTSAGMLNKAKTLSLACKDSLLYNYTKSGKIKIDVANYLAGINVIDDIQILDLIVKHGLNSSQSRDLDTIKKSDKAQDLFTRIIEERDSRSVKRLIMYINFIDIPEIFTDLISGAIDLNEAQSKKDRLQVTDESTPDVQEDSLKIGKSLVSKISSLAAAAKIPVDLFLKDVLEQYEFSLKGEIV